MTLVILRDRLSRCNPQIGTGVVVDAQFLGEFAERCTIADRLDAKPALQRLEAALQLLLDPGVARIRQQMVIAVMADLVTGLKNSLGHRRMRVRRPTGDEERRLEIEL